VTYSIYLRNDDEKQGEGLCCGPETSLIDRKSPYPHPVPLIVADDPIDIFGQLWVVVEFDEELELLLVVEDVVDVAAVAVAIPNDVKAPTASMAIMVKTKRLRFFKFRPTSFLTSPIWN
jgi:hypothetical protein